MEFYVNYTDRFKYKKKFANCEKEQKPMFQLKFFFRFVSCINYFADRLFTLYAISKLFLKKKADRLHRFNFFKI